MAGTYEAYESQEGRPIDHTGIFRQGLRKETIESNLNDRYSAYNQKIHRAIDEHIGEYREHLSEDAYIEIDTLKHMFLQCVKLMPLTLRLRQTNPYPETQYLDECLATALKLIIEDLLTRTEDCNLRIRSCWMRMHFLSLEILKCFLGSFINREGELYKELLDEGTIGLYSSRAGARLASLNIPKSHLLIRNNIDALFELCHKIVSSADADQLDRHFANALAEKSLHYIHRSWKEFATGQLDRGTSSVIEALQGKLIAMREQEPRSISLQVYNTILIMLADMHACARQLLRNKCINSVMTLETHNVGFAVLLSQLLSTTSTSISGTVNETKNKIIQCHMQLIYTDLEDLVSHDSLSRLRGLSIPDINMGSQYGKVGGNILKFLVVRQLHIDIVKAGGAITQSTADNTERVLLLLRWLEILPSTTQISTVPLTENEAELLEPIKIVMGSYRTSVLDQRPNRPIRASDIIVSTPATAAVRMYAPMLAVASSESMQDNTPVHRVSEAQQSIEMARVSANHNSTQFTLERLSELSSRVTQLMTRVSQGDVREDEVSTILSRAIGELFPDNSQVESRSNY